MQFELDSDIVFEDACWRVLVADTSAAVCAALDRVCSMFGTRIDRTEVTSGAQCLAALASNEFDLAFIDAHLPDMSGLAALEAARDAGSRTFVVVVSEDQSAGSIGVARALRAYEYLPKPILDADIRRVLSNYSEIRLPKTVLLVDDSGTARRLMTRVLRRSIFDLAITEAPDAVAGFEIYARRPADFVMLDLNMSGLDGLNAARIFRAHRPDSKIVIISADWRALKRVDPRYDVLAKPFDTHALDAVLHRVFRLRMPFEDLQETDAALV